MNKTIIGLFAFVVGASIGSFATFKLLKNKYEQLANNEIEEIRDFYRKKENDEKEITEYEQLAETYTESFTTTNNSETLTINIPNNMPDKIIINEGKKGGTESMDNEIYIISPDSYGELDNYDTVSFTYYADKILTNESDEPIEDVSYYICDDFADHFGEFEDDSVYVRNERLKCDFEILISEREYYDD